MFAITCNSHQEETKNINTGSNSYVNTDEKMENLKFRNIKLTIYSSE